MVQARKAAGDAAEKASGGLKGSLPSAPKLSVPNIGAPSIKLDPPSFSSVKIPSVSLSGPSGWFFKVCLCQ